MKINELVNEDHKGMKASWRKGGFVTRSNALIKSAHKRKAKIAKKMFLSLCISTGPGMVIGYITDIVKDKNDAKWLFDLSKDEILYHVLKEIKVTDDNTYDDLKHIISSLRKAKVDWPELDIIERSLNADKKLDEDADHDEILYYYWDNFVYSLKDFEVHTAMSDLGRYLKAGGSKEKAKDALEKYKEKIIKSVLLQLSYGHVSLLNTVLPLMHQVGIDWPELDLDYNKESIIKNLLTLTRKEHYNIVAKAVDELRTQNVDWPELDIIDRSLKADKMVNEEREQGYYLERMLDDIDLHLSNNDVSTAMHWIRHYYVDRGDVSVLLPYLEKYKDRILKYISSKFHAGQFVYAQDAIIILNKMNVAWPELDTVYEDNKDIIVRKVLWTVKHRVPVDAKNMIAKLRGQNIDWPELDIIERSLNAGK
jgi:hypothetical protein